MTDMPNAEPPPDQAPPSDQTPEDPAPSQDAAQEDAAKAGDTVRVRANVAIFDLQPFEEGEIGLTPEVRACIDKGLLEEL